MSALVATAGPVAGQNPKLAWEAGLEHDLRPVAELKDSIILANGTHIQRISRTTGKSLWLSPYRTSAISSLPGEGWVIGKRLFLMAADRMWLCAISLADGSRLRAYDFQKYHLEGVLASDKTAIVCAREATGLLKVRLFTIDLDSLNITEGTLSTDLKGVRTGLHALGGTLLRAHDDTRRGKRLSHIELAEIQTRLSGKPWLIWLPRKLLLLPSGLVLGSSQTESSALRGMAGPYYPDSEQADLMYLSLHSVEKGRARRLWLHTHVDGVGLPQASASDFWYDRGTVWLSVTSGLVKLNLRDGSIGPPVFHGFVKHFESNGRSLIATTSPRAKSTATLYVSQVPPADSKAILARIPLPPDAQVFTFSQGLVLFWRPAAKGAGSTYRLRYYIT